MGRFWPSCGCLRAKTASASGGASPPWPPDQGLCPWTPLGALPPDPRYRLALPRSPCTPRSLIASDAPASSIPCCFLFFFSVWLFVCLFVCLCLSVRLPLCCSLTYSFSYYHSSCAVGGQHDGHLPFWLPAFVKLISLLYYVFCFLMVK